MLTAFQKLEAFNVEIATAANGDSAEYDRLLAAREWDARRLIANARAEVHGTGHNHYIEGIEARLPSSEILRWNTGRPYTANGQRMVAIVVEGGALFVDRDRQIDGFLAGDFATDAQRKVMSAYDAGAYQSPPTPQLGDALRALRAVA